MYEASNKIDTIFEHAFINSPNIKSVINLLKNKALISGYKVIKSTIGSEFYINNSDSLKYILSFLYERNINIISDKQYKLFPEISFNSFKMIDENTFIFISWDIIEGESSGYIYIFGKKSYKYYKKFKRLIDHDIVNKRYTRIHSVYAINNSDVTGWKGITKRVISRPFDTLYFDNNIEEKIKDHIDKWLANKDVYNVRGITFKTGILLYGPPGTGKSSIAEAVADYLDVNIITIDSATFKDLNINEVSASISTDERMYVVLLDDIDVIFTSRKNNKITIDDEVKISKLLSFLDSANSPDNVIFIATTNYIEVFDEAITRPGRFDMVMEVGYISKSTARRMCKGFGLSNEETNKLLSSYSSDKIEPADLQKKILGSIKKNLESEQKEN